MDKDPRTAPADKTWVALIRDLLRHRKRAYALFFGAMAGMGVAILNLSAAEHEQGLQELFDVLDSPVICLMNMLEKRFGLFRDDVDTFYALIAIICYWTLVGVFLAWLFCVIRRYGFIGIAKGITHDGICRRVLFYGTVGGMLIGCLNFAAVIKNWNIEDSFEAVTRPAIALIETLRDRIIFGDSLALPGARGMGMLYFLAAAIIFVYWAVIGFLLASLFCFIRVIRKKSSAVEARASADYVSSETG